MTKKIRDILVIKRSGDSGEPWMVCKFCRNEKGRVYIPCGYGKTYTLKGLRSRRYDEECFMFDSRETRQIYYQELRHYNEEQARNKQRWLTEQKAINDAKEREKAEMRQFADWHVKAHDLVSDIRDSHEH